MDTWSRRNDGRTMLSCRYAMPHSKPNVVPLLRHMWACTALCSRLVRINSFGFYCRNQPEIHRPHWMNYELKARQVSGNGLGFIWTLIYHMKKTSMHSAHRSRIMNGGLLCDTDNTDRYLTMYFTYAILSLRFTYEKKYNRLKRNAECPCGTMISIVDLQPLLFCMWIGWSVWTVWIVFKQQMHRQNTYIKLQRCNQLITFLIRQWIVHL